MADDPGPPPMDPHHTDPEELLGTIDPATAQVIDASLEEEILGPATETKENSAHNQSAVSQETAAPIAEEPSQSQLPSPVPASQDSVNGEAPSPPPAVSKETTNAQQDGLPQESGNVDLADGKELPQINLTKAPETLAVEEHKPAEEPLSPAPAEESEQPNAAEAMDTSEQLEPAEAMDTSENEVPKKPVVPEIPDDSKEPVLVPLTVPEGMKIEEKHPFDNQYVKYHKAKKPSEKTNFPFDFYNRSLSHIQDFRNYSVGVLIAQAKQRTSTGKVPEPQQFDNILTEDDLPDTVSGAVFEAVGMDGGTVYCSPVNPEIVANDRPDLQKICLTPVAEDIKNGKHPHATNYHLGDIFRVTSLYLRDGITKEDILNPERVGGKVWNIHEFAVMERLLRTSDSSIFKGCKKRRSVWSATATVPTLTTIREDLLEAAGIPKKIGQRLTATVLIPRTRPGRFLFSLNPKFRPNVIKKTIAHAFRPSVPPSVIKVERLPTTVEEGYKSLPQPYANQKLPPKDEVGFKALIRAARLGLAGVVSLQNKNRDPRGYTTTVTQVDEYGKPLVTFDIAGLSSAPRLEHWASGTKFQLVTELGSHELEVEDAENMDTFLRIKATPVSGNPTVAQAVRASLDTTAAVFQKPASHKRQVENFPTYHDFRPFNPNLPFRLLFEAMGGGDRIPDQEIPEFELPHRHPDKYPTRAQLMYINAILYTSIPALATESPFGVGKTFMIALALIELAIKAAETKELHVATTVTNAGIAVITRALIANASAANVQVRGVRYVSRQNHDSLDNSVKTEWDTPTLIPTVTEKFIRDWDNNNHPDTRPGELVQAAWLWLRQNGVMTGSDTRNIHLKDESKGFKAMDEVAMFIQIHKPTILLGTSASLTEFLYYKRAEGYGARVATVQIDEASQFPFCALVALAATCPNARYFMVGDTQQLPPYADTDLPKDMKSFAVGNILAVAAKKVQNLSVLQVYRCPFMITKLCSDLFYQGRLESMRSRKERCMFAQALGLSIKYPLHTIDVRGKHEVSGTSLINERELDIAEIIVRKLKKAHPLITIGILTYYKAQAGRVAGSPTLAGHFIGTAREGVVLPLPADAARNDVGTIDASQGQEFDATIILTTRSSGFDGSAHSRSFIDDGHRLNVALSRTKEICIVLVCKDEAVKTNNWARYFTRLDGRGERSDTFFKPADALPVTESPLPAPQAPLAARTIQPAAPAPPGPPNKRRRVGSRQAGPNAARGGRRSGPGRREIHL